MDTARSLSCTGRGIGRQGKGSLLERRSYVSALCPVVLCPHLCTSEEGARKGGQHLYYYPFISWIQKETTG